jgi:hypothetical protein
MHAVSHLPVAMPRPNLPSMMSRRPARLLSTMLPHISHTPRISHQPLSPRLSPIPHPTPYIVQHIHPVPSVSAIKPSILVNMFTTSELRRLVNMNSACMHTSPYPFRRMHFPMTYLSCIPLHTESVFTNAIIIEKRSVIRRDPPPLHGQLPTIVTVTATIHRAQCTCGDNPVKP